MSSRHCLPILRSVDHEVNFSKIFGVQHLLEPFVANICASDKLRIFFECHYFNQKAVIHRDRRFKAEVEWTQSFIKIRASSNGVENVIFHTNFSKNVHICWRFLVNERTWTVQNMFFSWYFKICLMKLNQDQKEDVYAP